MELEKFRLRYKFEKSLKVKSPDVRKDMGRMAKDKIKIENLEVFAHHGVFPEENEKGQPFFVNATLFTNTREAGCKDELTLSIHYGEVCHTITKFMQEHTWKLIESVAEQLARYLLLEYDRIEEIELEIRKPYAPVGLPFESVSVQIQRGWHQVYLSVGSNVSNKRENIEKGIALLGAQKEIKKIKRSSFYQTEAYGGVSQEDFLNGAIELVTFLSPEELLKLVKKIEVEIGREETLRWGPRVLDMDILFYDNLVLDTEELTIPHIDMQNRTFVLEPLQELCRRKRHPVLGKSVQELLVECQRKENIIPLGK